MSYGFAWHIGGIIGLLLIFYLGRKAFIAFRLANPSDIVFSIISGLVSGSLAAIGVALLLTVGPFVWLLELSPGIRGFFFFGLCLIVALLLGELLGRIFHVSTLKYVSMIVCIFWLVYPVWYLWIRLLLNLTN